MKTSQQQSLVFVPHCFRQQHTLPSGIPATLNRPSCTLETWTCVELKGSAEPNHKKHIFPRTPSSNHGDVLTLFCQNVCHVNVCCQLKRVWMSLYALLCILLFVDTFFYWVLLFSLWDESVFMSLFSNQSNLLNETFFCLEQSVIRKFCSVNRCY